jgi:DNA-binding NarL/FixJ family response regulator
VAILDISMPDLDGVHVTRRIREAVPDTKILVLTMHESDQMVQRAFDAGAHGYILKPDLPEALPKAVEAVLEGKRFLQQAERAGARATPREIEIIRLLAEGKTNKATAALLGITVRTVETHRSKIMLKLGLHSLADLIHYAIRQGLVAPGGPKVARPDKAAHPAFAKTRAV